MVITVTDGQKERKAVFREGTRASEVIAALDFDFALPCGGMGRCGKCICKVDGKNLHACKTPLFKDSFIEIPPNKTTVLTAEKKVEGANGAVIDIGTTTLAAALFRDGAPVKTLGRRNPQCAYGADVISRIAAPDKSALTLAINDAVKEIRQKLGESENTVITGNTAMLSLLCGLDVSEMGVHPFKMPSAFDLEYEGTYLPPCANAFVGADALCSMLYTGANGTALMLDLGTNGEIGLLHKGKYYFTSTAAGPALEGANISRGMAADSGAIFRVNTNNYKMIGDASPIGICGSGLVDAIALMLDGGAMDTYGTLNRDFEIHNSGVFITQDDVRAFQLCKAAIAAGAKTLLKKQGLTIDNIDKIYLSGALGQNIDLRNAIRTGLLPSAPIQKFTAIGNGALLGGAMLLDEANRNKIRAMTANCQCLNLGTDVDFVESYIAEMNF